MPIRQERISAPITPALTAAFSRTLSPERWRTYQKAAGFDDNFAHRLYLWNAAVGQSFHFPLQSVEVALRNMVHGALSDNFGHDWCQSEDCIHVLKPSERNDLDTSIRRLKNMNKEAPSTAQVVASLSLGFWVSMLKTHYHAPVWGASTIKAFPNLSEKETINDVSRIAQNIRNLRNRIFHQEPLIGRNLSQDYSDILKMLGWICWETREWTRRHSSVSKVIREKPKP